MFRNLATVLLVASLMSGTVHAEFSYNAKVGLGLTAATAVILNTLSAAFSYESKYEIDTVVGETRRAAQEGACATRAIAAALTLASASMLGCGSVAVVPLAGFAMAKTFMGQGLNALAFHKDENRADHGYHIAAFVTGVFATAANIGMFIGAHASHHSASGSNSPV